MTFFFSANQISGFTSGTSKFTLNNPLSFIASRIDNDNDATFDVLLYGVGDSTESNSQLILSDSKAADSQSINQSDITAEGDWVSTENRTIPTSDFTKAGDLGKVTTKSFSSIFNTGDYLGRLMRLDEDTMKPVKLPSINPRSLDTQIAQTRKLLKAAQQQHRELLAVVQRMQWRKHYFSVAIENERRLQSFYQGESDAMAATMLTFRRQLRKVKSTLSMTEDSDEQSRLLIQHKLIKNNLKQIKSESVSVFSQRGEQNERVDMRQAQLARQTERCKEAEMTMLLAL